MKFIGKMHAFYCELLEVWAKTDVDALNMMDDWARRPGFSSRPAFGRRSSSPCTGTTSTSPTGRQEDVHALRRTHAGHLPRPHRTGAGRVQFADFLHRRGEARAIQGADHILGRNRPAASLSTGTIGEVEAAVTNVKRRLGKRRLHRPVRVRPRGRPENVRKVFETWDN